MSFIVNRDDSFTNLNIVTAKHCYLYLVLKFNEQISFLEHYRFKQNAFVEKT